MVPEIMPAKVDFPLPDSPISPKHSPAAIYSDVGLTTSTGPRRPMKTLLTS